MAKLLFEEPKFRVGTGYDIHKFIKVQNGAESFIKICGVKIEHNMAIEAHSDGDVAIHAIVDAILGALGCGDIGEHFLLVPLNGKIAIHLTFLTLPLKKQGKRVQRV
ncbi:hypothetical protein TNCT_479331 [Trichonephila clavata]|uniref:2-C-methyl-D-erythritol 2,4-cyclodiphosphate synthase n=1 Tax=Trichonephila clavata TaxID=2740835 RepID=A0A8X6G6E7_TRICU|nr:hypothetical protein TNCT_479331 [Trichonephila clavata]